MIYNPWHGCRKKSEGCQNCYVYALDQMHGKDASEIYKVKSNFNLPVRKDRNGNYKIPSGSYVQLGLSSDFFLEEADPWREDVWTMIRKRKDLFFEVITKRIERVRDCLPSDWGAGYPNFRLRVTVENQIRADERLPLLLDLSARHKAVMCAPMLGPIDLSPYLKSGMIESVFADGENYQGARVLDYDWVKSLSEQCLESRVPFYFIGTGAEFRKDGKLYHLKSTIRKEQARKSNLSHPGWRKNESFK